MAKRQIRNLLVAVGKPFFLIFSSLVVVTAFLIHTTSKIKFGFKIRKPAKKRKKEKIIYQKRRWPKISFPAIKFPKLKLPQIGIKLRLKQLHLFAVELKIFSKIGRFFRSISKFLKNRKFKFRLKIILPLAVLLLLPVAFYLIILKDLPSPNDLTVKEPEVSTKIYDRNGVLLYKIYKDQNRTIVPLGKIPLQVRLSTLAAEDAEFYSHPGFSVKGIFRAIGQNLKTGTIQGGSTITQQLVKNRLLTPEKTITRKVREIILSVGVEAKYTKDQILEMYLNEISYGGTAYGIEEAGRLYFGKDVEKLSLAEAAFLAGLTKSPTTYSPFGPNPNIALQRQKEILRLMEINKFINHEQRAAAEAEILIFAPNKTEIKAPHFVMYIRQMLVSKYGEGMVEKGGLEVTTSLDMNIQTVAEEVVKTEVEKLRGLSVGNGAALIVNPQTGEILSMVGSKDYFDTANDGNVNVTQSLRSPGSSIKVVNYSYALAKGYTPASLIDDSPITYSVAGQPPYSPKNYDGQFKGRISLRSALGESRNIPAVKVLVSYGVGKMIDQGQKMGITSWQDPGQYGLSLTLGGGAVSMLDLSRVYSTLANQGKRPEMMPILEIKNYKGKVLEKNSPQTSQAIDPRIAFLVTDILKDNNARAPEFGYNSYLVIKNHPEVAVKTGTSNDLRDNWAAGYNQNYLVITWVGNNNNSPMNRIASGITGASPIWNKITSAILANQASIDWKVPDGVSKVNICSVTGTLPCNGCPTRQEWFLDETKPTKYCLPEQLQNTPNPSGINQILETGIQTNNSR
jgi:penicillin-binding protein 1C